MTETGPHHSGRLASGHLSRNRPVSPDNLDGLLVSDGRVHHHEPDLNGFSGFDPEYIYTDCRYIYTDLGD